MNEIEATTLPGMVAKVTVSFSWYDYVIFSAMLAISAMIGIYFGCFGSKQSTASEYLMGGKKMKVFPIVMSLVASHISGITLLGVPADVYKYGAAYWLSVVAFQIVTIISIFIYLPVLFNAEVTSVYEYLEKRFDRKTRMFSSFLFGLSQVLFLPIVVYIPALAFSAATGINLHLITPLICGVCIFYTTIGGLKAVVWTDTLQFTITLGAVTTVLILGVQATGGFNKVWIKAIQGQRLDFLHFDLDVSRSDNFWAPLIGLTTLWIAMTNTNQGCIQKLLSVSSLKNTKLATILFGLGMAVVKTASVFTGLIIYARYSNCDPFTANQIKRKDQLLPYYVLDVAGDIPGLSGLFIAGVFSAGLSTLSAHLNCLSGTIYEDFICKLVPNNISEKSKSNILKLIVVVCGVVCTILVFVFEHLGGILPLAIAFAGLTAGPMLGMFTLGVLVRKANSRGAFYGGFIGLVLISLLAVPTKYLQSRGELLAPEKPISVEGCGFNFTTHFRNSTDVTGVWSIFRISFYYYTLIGFTFTMFFGLVISYFGDDEHIVDEDLLCPLIQKPRVSEYNTVEKALNLVLDNSGKSNLNL